MPESVHSSKSAVNRSNISVYRKQATVNRRLWRPGFTLIELLIAVTIIGVLLGGIAFAFNNARDKARDSKRKQDLSAIKGSLDLYYQDNGTYAFDTSTPSKTTFNSTDTQPWIPGLVPTYIKELPTEAKQEISGLTGNYRYVVSADKTDYTLWAILENTSDAEIYNKPTASCKRTPPSGGYNYCATHSF